MLGWLSDARTLASRSNLASRSGSSVKACGNRVTRDGSTSAVEYARYADDLVVLVHEGRRWDWVLRAVHRRLREEFGKLRVEVNEEKSRVVDLRNGESFGFLGFVAPQGSWTVV